jgi:hypothetical protein
MQKVKTLTAITLVLALASISLGQQAATPRPKPAETHEDEQQPQPATTPKADPAAARPIDYVETRDFKGRIFEVKHRNPAIIVQAISNLGSGFKGAKMSYNLDLNTIVVRDFPENIAAIEEAIKRFDTPEPPRPDIDLRMHVLIASNAGGTSNQYPADLADVVKQLQSTLNYKNYHLIASVMQRVKDQTRNINGRGVALVGPPLAESNFDARYNWVVVELMVSPAASGPATIQLKRVDFSLNPNEYTSPLGQASISTELSVRDGEKVVVGTATLKDKALVLVLTARIIK